MWKESFPVLGEFNGSDDWIDGTGALNQLLLLYQKLSNYPIVVSRAIGCCLEPWHSAGKCDVIGPKN